MAAIERVAVLGAGGTMGFPIARNLARAGLVVRAWNRTPEKAQRLTEEGATVVSTPVEAADGAQAILTMLRDADAVVETMDGEDGALDRAAAGAIWIQVSTIGIDGTERCAKLAERRGLAFVDAPVLGTRAPAEQGELVVLASGPESVPEQLDAVFDAIAKKILWVGEAGAGTRLKLVTNSWIVALVEGAAETIAFAEGIGVDPAMFLEAVAGGPLDLPYLQMKGTAMIERRFEPSFKLALAAKDARLVKEAAERHGLDLPLLELIARRLTEGAAEHGDEDLAATYLTSAPGGSG
jgi:3-hydroxyisobutyrate dehydrogenase